MKKYKVINKLTSAVCGVFNTPNEAGKWVEEYTHEQNDGVNPNSKEYCSPFHFELKEVEIQGIASYEDAVDFLGIKALYSAGETRIVGTTPKHYKALSVLTKLFTIAEAWNKQDGFVPDFSNKNQYKYFPWFKYNNGAAGFVCVDTHWAVTSTDTNFGSRLCFATPERAIAFGKQFEHLYNDFLLIQ